MEDTRISQTGWGRGLHQPIICGICFYHARWIFDLVLLCLHLFVTFSAREVLIKLFLRQTTSSETRERSRWHLASWKSLPIKTSREPETNTSIFAIFYENCMKLKKKLDRGGGGARSKRPFGIDCPLNKSWCTYLHLWTDISMTDNCI